MVSDRATACSCCHKGRTFIPNIPNNPMGYIHDLEGELSALLQLGDAQAVIKYVKEHIVESYKNGIMAAKLVKADKDTTRQTKRFARGE